MTEPLHSEIDRLAQDAAAEAPDVDLPRLRRRAARRRSTRLTGLATAGVALAAGTGLALSQLDTSASFGPANPGPVIERPHPACGERHHALLRSVLLPIEVGATEGDLRVAVEATDTPAVTTWVRATEASGPSDEPARAVRAVVDAEGPSLVIADPEGTVVGYARLAQTPGARDLHPGESLEYEGYAPFTQCPSAEASGGTPVAAGSYFLLVDGSWTLPDGGQASLSRPVGTLLVTSRNATAFPAHPACGERRSSAIDFAWRPVDVGIVEDVGYRETPVAAPPPVSARVFAPEIDYDGATPPDDVRAVVDPEGPALLIVDGEETVIGYSRLARAPGSRTLHSGESLEYEGYEPLVRCPSADHPGGDHVVPGAYPLHIEISWTLPDGERASLSRPAGTLLVNPAGDGLGQPTPRHP